MKLIKKIGDISLIFLCILSVLVSIFYVIYHYNFKSTTTSTFYIGGQSPVNLLEKSDELTEEQIGEYEKRVLLNVNLYSNDNKNGVALSEMRLDYFTDYTMDINSCKSSGLQYVFDSRVFDEISQKDNLSSLEKLFLLFAYADNSIYYYETYQDISWSGGDSQSSVEKPLSRDFSFICKINDVPYLFQLDGTYQTQENTYFLGIKTGTKIVTKNYEYYHLASELFNSVKSNSKGYGDYYLSIDISKYFTSIKAYNPETQQFDKEPVTDISKKYCMMKFHYDADGALISDDSMFDLIACNANYNYNGISDTEYWQERFVYRLDADDLDYRYSESFGGYYASLPFEDKGIFSSMPRIKVEVSIDLNSTYLTTNKINFIGFDYNAFENVEIDTLKIAGDGNIKFLDKAFYNTNLKIFEHSSTIICEYGTDVFNNEFTEVLL